MNNFEKYNKLHTEVMKRLEDGEITIETAKEVNDLAFDKYINIFTESVKDIFNKIRWGIKNFKNRHLSYEDINIDYSKLNNGIKEKIDYYKRALKADESAVRKLLDDVYNEYMKDKGIPRSIISFNPSCEVRYSKIYKKNEVQEFNCYIIYKYAVVKFTSKDIDGEKLFNFMSNKGADFKDKYGGSIIDNSCGIDFEYDFDTKTIIIGNSYRIEIPIDLLDKVQK